MHQIELLKKYGLSVRGVRGQYLLVDENVQRKWIACVDPKPNDFIIEIGPGLGALTEGLLKSGAHVIAVERDERFIQILEGELGKTYKRLRLIQGDILKINLKKFAKPPAKLKIVGNIPYYITSPILLHLIAHRDAIDSAYLAVQREVADRIFAQPGTKVYGRLTLLVRFYADVKRQFDISRNCFSPKPAVDSTVIELIFRRSLPDSFDEAVFFDLVKAGFGERRKNILNALAAGLKDRMQKEEIRKLLASAGIRKTERAENLMLKDFMRLAEHAKALPLPKAQGSDLNPAQLDCRS